MTIDVSVVVPVMDEQDNVEILLGEIVSALEGEAFEVLFVDDLSRDQTVDVLRQAKSSTPQLRVLCHKENCGQSTAVRTGVLHARGELVVVLDGDGQNDPADIPALLKTFRREDQPSNLGMVGGLRQGRQDSLNKKLTSKFGNAIRRKLLDDRTTDAGCGLKVFVRSAFLEIPHFDHMHRYMSALMIREGYEVDFIPVNHRAREHGQSKYGFLDRAMVSLSDIFGVMWLRRRARRPSKVDEA